MVLEDLLCITQRGIANTYFNGEKIYNDYLAVKEMLNSGYKPAQIVRGLFGVKSTDRAKYDVLLRKIKRWASKAEKTTTPEVVKGINKLESLGLFPFTYKNEKFDIVNAIGSWLFWKGLLVVADKGRPSGNYSYELRFDFEDSQEAINLKFLLGKLEITDPYTSKYNSVGVTGPVSRLFTQLGYPIGKKSQEKIIIPQYIETIEKASNLTKDEAYLKEKIIRTFVDGLFYLRKGAKENHFKLALHYFAEKSVSREQAEMLSGIIRKNYALETKIRGPYERETNNFYSKLIFLKEGVNLSNNFLHKLNAI